MQALFRSTLPLRSPILFPTSASKPLQSIPILNASPSFSSSAFNAPVNYGSSFIRAAVITGPKQPLRIEQLKMPKPKGTEILVKVRACGVCHSDLHVIKGNSTMPFPLVVGHEVTGEVADYGPLVDEQLKKKLPLGQKVVSSFILPCGTCGHCVTGKEDICETFAASRAKGVLLDGETRLFRKDNTPVYVFSSGGFAEYSVIPSNAVFALPPEIPHADSAVIGCAVFTAFGAVRNAANLQAGETVAIYGGGGGVGSQIVQIAKAFGADQVIAIDISEDKLKAATALGATDTIDASKNPEVPQAVRKLTRGRGVDVAIEVLGRPSSFQQAIESVADGGRAVMVGIAPPGVNGNVNITHIVRRQIKIIGSYGGKARQDMPQVLRLAQRGAIDISSGITKRYYSIEDTNEAYTALAEGKYAGRAVVQFDK